MVIMKPVENLSLDAVVGLVASENHLPVTALQFIIYTSCEMQRFANVKSGQVVSYSSGWLEGVGRRLGRQERESMGITSKVKIDGFTKHLVAVTFRSGVNLDGAYDVITGLGFKSGFFIQLVGSVHFLGFDLLCERDWKVFMERCWQQEAIGYDWPTCQLQKGFSVVPISSPLAGPQPKVVAQLIHCGF